MRVHTVLRQQVQTALHVLFPPSCCGCGGMVESDFGLCGTCWRSLPLISGPVCHKCGAPVLAECDDVTNRCEDCVRTARPWSAGRSALRYSDKARHMILGLKHSDRQEVAITSAAWLAIAGRSLITNDTLLIPVPLHWTRLVQRRYNQSALLSQHLALRTGCTAVLDGLLRTAKTKPLEGVTVVERFERLRGVIRTNPKHKNLIAGRSVVIVDDVMTSGATLAACTEACLANGAGRVDVLTLARVCKDD